MYLFINYENFNKLKSLENYETKKNNFNLKTKKNSNNLEIQYNKEPRLHEIAHKLEYLLSNKKYHESSLQENINGHLESSLHIAVIFSKTLINKQISLEFSRRISTLVTHINSGKIKPDMVAFISNKRRDDKISSCESGYIYFRFLCSQLNIDIGGIDFSIHDKSDNFKENLKNLTMLLKNKYNDEAITKCHFTLVSSDYHLIRIAEIHKISRKNSILNSINYHGATWTYLFAAYPFCVSPDPTLAFLGRIRVLANDLTIVLVNIDGFLKTNELIAKENYTRLCETNKKLRALLRIMNEKSDHFEQNKNNVNLTLEQWEVLEKSLCITHEIQQLLSIIIFGRLPDRYTIIKSRDLFIEAIRDIKRVMDPDRPLFSKEWNTILKDVNHL
ncbi:hypothetical protein (nucleomorph) [Guillardia theta]|uniref:DUF218 domain-containing protein n=1 Tax=Guillardia theta TaxID=55529 RepID=Q98S20_GUITH|nr:hypothetical protein GTHECHR3116 [Guillardia theta]AAK39760.1 hypothetical protein [Guillardia theta]|mmetsp:Transcript_20548/g.68870  ORF Transcript_20548/g.68870 Transcript_20548/m.68870 type:complete len:388 (+) Transcript_20548:5227-6390(+)